jgi:hypothetical protein
LHNNVEKEKRDVRSSESLIGSSTAQFFQGRAQITQAHLQRVEFAFMIKG